MIVCPRWPGADTTSRVIGAGDRDRTDDSLLGRQKLYQLSYTREFFIMRIDLALR